MNFIRTGFRAVRQNPALIFAEIAWRWAFGAAAWTLVILTVRAILQGVDVSAAEATLVRTDNAYLIADIITRILVQVLPRIVHAMWVVVPALCLFWIAAATIGRALTLRTLISDGSAGVSPAVPPASSRQFLPSLILLNALRALFAVATLLAFFGTVFLISSRFTPEAAPDAAPALVLAWLFLAFVVGFLWGVVNWFLALAPLFALRDRLGVWKSISESLGLYRGHGREYLAIASSFGLIRGAALLVAIVAAAVAAGAGSFRAGLIASIVVALVYFAIADWLYIARLAAYAGLAGSGAPTAEASPVVAPAPEPAIAMPPAETETETETHSGLS